jgi:hypothetical protein
MRLGKTVVLVVLAVIVAGVAHADTKIVQLSHQDSFTMMGQTQPATDTEQVLWIGSDRMRLDQGESSVLVRTDLGKIYFLDHVDKTSSAADLPLDIEKYLPQGMAEQISQMMKFEVTVTPREETKTIGDWQTTGYDVAMVSPMVTVNSVIWVSSDLNLDFDTFYRLYESVVAVQPGMKDLIEALHQIGGFVIKQEGEAKMSMMGDSAIKTTQTTVSIDEGDAPAGTYDPPTDYVTEELDLMAMMQKRRGR